MSVAASPRLAGDHRRAIFSRKGTLHLLLEVEHEEAALGPCLISQSKYLPLNSKSRIRSSCTGMAIPALPRMDDEQPVAVRLVGEVGTRHTLGTYTSVSSSEHLREEGRHHQRQNTEK